VAVSYRQIVVDGLWSNNPGLVQLLGLCPLLAVSNTAINGLALGLATTLTLLLSNSIVSLIRHYVRPEIRLPVFVLVIASIVTAIQLAMNAWFYELYLILGIFIPLIVTNCSIIGRAEGFASKNTLPRAALDGVMMGLGFTALLFTLGSMRELLGNATLLSQAHLLFGEAARGWSIVLIEDYRGFLVAVLPPGAFFGLGLLIALKNVIDRRLQARRSIAPTAETLSGPA
jgi:electron transport complex protein RnfE